MTQTSEPQVNSQVGIDRLFVTVGTDYHRFDRLVEWLDEWLATDPEVGQIVLQRGTSSQSKRIDSIDYLQRAQLIKEFQQATVVVCHGGPATILECRSNGIVPIVVPRERRFGEHVNDHQVDFCERLNAHGEIQMARTKNDFFTFLEHSVERGAPIVALDDGHADIAMVNFEDRMVELLGSRARSLARSDEHAEPKLQTFEQIPVIFIGSVPRSGSTIVSDLLNENPHMVNIGELVHIWERGLIENNLCGCGVSFSECVFWGKVGDVAFGGWKHLSGERMRTLQLRADRTRHIPALLIPKVSRFLATSTIQYGAVISRILRAIIEVSGKPVIVDTSKHVSTALLLRQLPDIDLKVIHLVRDPRGVAHSWSKVVDRPEVQGENRPMDTLHPGRLGLRWLWFNWAFTNMDRLGVPSATIRYEDFVASPAETLDQVFSFSGVEQIGAELFDSDEPLCLGEGHSVSGNPRRLDRRPIELRVDDSWRTDFDPTMRRLVGRVARPMLDRYHYSKDA